MASVWRHPESQYWTTCFRDENGSERRIITKEANSKKELKNAEEFITDIDGGALGESNAWRWNYLATRRGPAKEFARGALNERQGAASGYQRGSRNPRPPDPLVFWRRYSA